MAPLERVEGPDVIHLNITTYERFSVTLPREETNTRSI